MTDEEYLVLKDSVMALTGIDLDSYKSQQMRRRLAFFVEKMNGLDTPAYCQKIKSDKESLRKLRDYLTINVTEFFRDVWAFAELENNILPAMLRTKKSLRVWSAGCSNGGEPYSLAILLNSLAEEGKHEILATDVDEQCLALAGAGGPYGLDSIKNIPQRYIQNNFINAEKGLLVKPEIRDMVRFKRQNILSDPFERGFDLICCRNVTIYFTDEAKNVLNEQFHRSLNNDGILFIGATEFINNATALGFNKMCNCFYRKVTRQQQAGSQPGELLAQAARR